MKRNRFRFGLRVILAFTFVFASIFAWFAALKSEGRRHERIAAELISLGCNVQFSYVEWVPSANAPAMAIGGGTRMESRSTLPDFVETVGVSSAFRRIEYVTLRQRSKLEPALDLLREVGDVETISFYETGVTEAQLSDTLNAMRIRKLYIPSEKLPRTNMTWLNHAGLTWLCVARTQFSNPAIDDLPTSLEYFDATRTRINDDGLGAFLRLKNLKTLLLRRTPTSKREIEKLQVQMPWCEIAWEPLVNP